MKRKLTAFLLAVLMLCSVIGPSLAAYKPTTLRNGMRGEEVRELQEALILLGYLKGTPDGIFGTNTENAVRAFQRKNKMTSDGLAGIKTRELIMKQASEKKGTKTTTGTKTQATTKQTETKTTQTQTQGTGGSSTGSSLFGGDYSSLRQGASGQRVVALQNGLIKLKLLDGKADGKFGPKTLKGVLAFQRKYKLAVDGVAGKKTLTALEKALSGSGTGGSETTQTQTQTQTQTGTGSTGGSQTGTSTGINPKISAPSKGSIKLLSWYDQVKPALSNRQHLLIYDPSSGLSWTLSIISRGRHCDAEPLTLQDTQTMLKAFGGKNTWSQKGVYVRLPDGRWTIGSTHDMPHQTGSIKNNGFDGHLCVHFLRTMEEATKNDPNYGVSNQKTIRALWKKLTGQEITD